MTGSALRQRPSAGDAVASGPDVPPVRVLLIEDHLALREGMGLMLRARGFEIVGSAVSADAGYRLFEARRPDVAVVDLDLGGSSGLALIERILAVDPGAAVLVYTGTTDPELIATAAACGARGFALKTGGVAELVDAIVTVAAGGVYLDAAVARSLAGAAEPHLLTSREREVLGLLAAGTTGEEVATLLCLSPETIRTHIRNAMRKLDVKTRVHAVTLALSLGEIQAPIRN